MLRIVSFKICPFVQRVTALLEAKRIPYEVDYIDLTKKPDWFLDLSPNGQVPVLIAENGEVLFESDAIVEYIDEIDTPLVEVSPIQRAQDRAWSYQASKHYLVQCSAQRSGDLATLEERAGKLRKAFAKAEREIGAGPFFRGAVLGNVDIAWLPLLHRAGIIENRTGYDFLDGFPRVKSWQSALLKSEIVVDSVSVDFEDRFADFYLADDTYLGNLQATQRSEPQCRHSEACC